MQSDLWSDQWSYWQIVTLSELVSSASCIGQICQNYLARDSRSISKYHNQLYYSETKITWLVLVKYLQKPNWSHYIPSNYKNQNNNQKKKTCTQQPKENQNLTRNARVTAETVDTKGSCTTCLWLYCQTKYKAEDNEYVTMSKPKYQIFDHMTLKRNIKTQTFDYLYEEE